MISIIDAGQVSRYRTAMTPQALQRLALFHSLPVERLAHLLRGASVHRCRRGERLFRQGDRADAVWIVLDGWVHLVRSPRGRHDARSVVLCTVTPKEMLCGISAIEGHVYTASGIAGTVSQVLRLPREAFHDLLQREVAFTYQVLHACCERIRYMAQQYGTMAEPVPRRVARLLLRLREQFGDTIPMTHRELAQMAWTTTESAIRSVRHLKHRGIVRGRRGQLTLRDPSALEALVHRHDANGSRA